MNAANNNLKHNVGVAAAINNASGGAVQRESTTNLKLAHKVKLPTGDVIVTSAGGILKCKNVIHTVGPVISQHKDQCDSLLKRACINAMDAAKRFGATSISFPPIRSNISDVPTELVASAMLSTLCSYGCDPKFLRDVRIVITDRSTFEVFSYIFNEEKQNLESMASQIHLTSAATPDYCTLFQHDHSHSRSGTLSSPPGFPPKEPSYIQPNMLYSSYSHAVMKKYEGQPSSQKKQQRFGRDNY